MKKLEYDYIKLEFAKEKYQFLAKKYINSYQKLEYICQKGHRHSISWNDWRYGARCPYCAGQGKPTMEFIKAEFKKERYELLSNKYINSKTKLQFICNKGHKHEITWAAWKNGQRCAYCYGNIKLDIGFIKRSFFKESYVLLSSKYINANDKLKYKCPNGHIHNIRWGDWQQGHRCPYCAGNVRLSINFVKKELKKKGYRLLNKYKNCYSNLICICPEGHFHDTTWNEWRSGCRCDKCANIDISNRFSGSGHPQWKGGISFEPYSSEFNGKLKKLILERDNHQCQNPDCWETVQNSLTIHHINYNKEDCGQFNLITLCRSCNGRANKDRNYWMSFYTDIMLKRKLINNRSFGGRGIKNDRNNNQR